VRFDSRFKIYLTDSNIPNIEEVHTAPLAQLHTGM